MNYFITSRVRGKNLMWSEEELNFLANNQHLSSQEIANRLGTRTKNAVIGKRAQLGLFYTNPRYKKWTAEEDAIIEKNRHLHYLDLAELLPNRTIEAVKLRRTFLS